MAQLMRSSLPTVTTIRFDLGPDQTIRIRDFLRGLKRPASKKKQSPALQSIPQNPKDLDGTVSPNEEPVLTVHAAPHQCFPDQTTEETALGDNDDRAMEATSITRKYKKKRKSTSAFGEESLESSPVFCSKNKENEYSEELLRQNLILQESRIDVSVPSKN